VDVISHPSFATLHAPESRGNDEHPGRLQSLLDRFPDHVVGEPAPRSRIEAVHSASYVDSIEGVSSEIWLDGDTYATATTWEAACLAAGCAIEAVSRGGFALRSISCLARAVSRPATASTRGHVATIDGRGESGTHSGRHGRWLSGTGRPPAVVGLSLAGRGGRAQCARQQLDARADGRRVS